jgi:hypothetical protein
VARGGVLHRNVEPLECLGLDPAPDAEVDATVTQVIEHRRVFGDPDGMLERENDNPEPQPNASRPRGQIGQHQHARRTTERGEVMAGQPDAVIAERLGEEHLLYDLVVALGTFVGSRLDDHRAEEHG